MYLQFIQYHGCWCPGDSRSQGINNNDTDYAEAEQFGAPNVKGKLMMRLIMQSLWTINNNNII